MKSVHHGKDIFESVRFCILNVQHFRVDCLVMHTNYWFKLLLFLDPDRPLHHVVYSWHQWQECLNNPSIHCLSELWFCFLKVLSEIKSNKGYEKEDWLFVEKSTLRKDFVGQPEENITRKAFSIWIHFFWSCLLFTKVVGKNEFKTYERSVWNNK